MSAARWQRRPPQLWRLRCQAGRPDRCRGDATEFLGRHRGGGLSVKLCQLLSCVGRSDHRLAPAPTTGRLLATTWTMATAAWVVVGRCASGANAIVNSDASSLLYGPAEAAHIYTAVPAG